MARLTILRGISGSGKSTWARQQNALVVSRDALRASFFPNFTPEEYYKSPLLRDMEDSITRIQDAAIEAALKAGKDVIVDNTNIEMNYVKALAKIGNRVGAEVEVKVFDVDLRTALYRVDLRARSGGLRVPDETIRKQHQRFQGTKDKSQESVVEPKPYNGTPGKPKAFMFDLDGTTYHMNGKRGPYDLNVDVDDPDPVVQEIVFALGTDFGGCNLPLVPIAMSGRKESARGATEAALNRDGVPFERLFMRADDDNRADNLIKADLFDEHVRDNYDVQFVIDDRRQVVDMWLRMGLKVLNVAGIDGGDF